MRATHALINKENLILNFHNIKKKVGKAKIMAVVKADAYGHNVKFVIDTLNSIVNKPDYYAVATVEEGIELKKLKVKQPILVFDPIDKSSVNEILKNKLIPTIFTDEHVKILIGALKKLKVKNQINVHVKIDTGMNRLGIEYYKAERFIVKLQKNKQINIDGVFTHFACSDEKENDYTRLQINRFNAIINKLKEKKIKFGLVHAANSGAIIDYPEAHYDMVRPGISLYGYYPSLETSESIKLLPVMSIVSKVGSVKIIDKNESISYSRRYFTKKQTKIISVPIGYADGLPRNLTNNVQAIIKNKIYNQVGTVTMDRIMFDVENDNIKVGDDVILIGKKGKFEIDAWDWSEKLNTIPYEVTCGISKRVPRVLLK